MSNNTSINEILVGLETGQIVPYLGAGVWAAAATPPAHPANHLQLVAKLTERVTVPHKIRKNLTAAAQYIENFKHRKTLAGLMNTAFAVPAQPTELHEFIASLHALPLVVDAWYDDAMQQALTQNPSWGQVQGVSQAEHHGEWVRYYTPDGALADAASAAHWQTLLYRPLGSAGPAHNYIVSDSDYVEILTEIDIQTPIPEIVQQRRKDRNFLFLGCRFGYQLDRIFARQIMKRSSDKHYAIIEGDLTKNEAKFLKELNITRLDMPLQAFIAAACGEAVV
ncbi:MAG: SIR2 family protein [Nitrosomonadales bacterium]|nr:SIR2 family protein [Nitrosomonadales bacterium]